MHERTALIPRNPALTVAIIAAAVLAALAIVLTLPASPAAADPQLDSEEQAFVTLINDYRAQSGLGPLSIDWELQASADFMSKDMGEKAYFSHNEPSGRNPWDRMCAFGYCYNTYKGENIAAGYTTAQQVFTAWQNSPGHNSNMLGASYHAMGIARVYTSGSPYGWYWTNDFGGVNSNADPPGGHTATPTATPNGSATPVQTASPTPVRTATPTPTPPVTSQPTPIVHQTASPSPTPTPNAKPLGSTPRATRTPVR